MAGDIPDFLEATQRAYAGGWWAATRISLGILWREHSRYASYPLRWPAIALIEAAQKLAGELDAGRAEEGRDASENLS